jgi:hypothetical protein
MATEDIFHLQPVDNIIKGGDIYDLLALLADTTFYLGDIERKEAAYRILLKLLNNYFELTPGERTRAVDAIIEHGSSSTIVDLFEEVPHLLKQLPERSTRAVDAIIAKGTFHDIRWRLWRELTPKDREYSRVVDAIIAKGSMEDMWMLLSSKMTEIQVKTVIDKIIENVKCSVSYLENLLKKYSSKMTEEQIATAIDKLKKIGPAGFGSLVRLASSKVIKIQMTTLIGELLNSSYDRIDFTWRISDGKRHSEWHNRSYDCTDFIWQILDELTKEQLSAIIHAYPEKIMQLLENSLENYFFTLPESFAKVVHENYTKVFQQIVEEIPRHAMLLFLEKYSARLNVEWLHIVEERVLLKSLTKICCKRLQQSDISPGDRDKFNAWMLRDCYPFQSLISANVCS